MSGLAGFMVKKAAFDTDGQEVIEVGGLQSTALPAGESVFAVVQPIFRLEDQSVIGYEALARIGSGPSQSPQYWLDKAQAAGVRNDLERLFLQSAARLGPPPGDAWLFVNASPAALADPALFALRSELPERLVLEITEQTAVEDYAQLQHHLEPWIEQRVRLAIDDTGAGYSSLRHVIELTPDFLKLDRELTRNLDRHPNRQSLLRALVAFAREVGASVIAEGVETPSELAALIAAGVPYAQGYLLARPGAPWVETEVAARRGTRPAVGGSRPDSLGALGLALGEARSVQQACDVVAAHLFERDRLMPSVYLERNRRLRCMAQRGLWQVLDGLEPGTGVTGRVWATGEPLEVGDVRASDWYLEAVPGIVGEVCVPVRMGDDTIGAINVDTLLAPAPGLRERLEECAALLAGRLVTMGWRREESALDRAVDASLSMAGLTDEDAICTHLLDAVLAVSRLDSAAVLLISDDRTYVASARGPLAAALGRVDPRHLAAMSAMAERVSSCYTGAEVGGVSIDAGDAIHAAGVRAAVMLPLRTPAATVGAVFVANSRPARLTSDVVEPLELLAGQAAAGLVTAGRGCMVRL